MLYCYLPVEADQTLKVIRDRTRKVITEHDACLYCLSEWMITGTNTILRDGPFDIQGGAGIFLKKIVRFPLGAKKLKIEVENKKFVLHSVNIFEALFSRSHITFCKYHRI